MRECTVNGWTWTRRPHFATMVAAIALVFAAGPSRQASAAQVTTITTGLVTDCIGENAAGTMSMQGCKLTATITDGKVTAYATECTELAWDMMTLPNSYGNQQAIYYRGYVVTKYADDNGIIPGYHFYDAQTGAEAGITAQDTLGNSVFTPFVINGANYSGWKKNLTRLHIIEGATQDQDRFVFLNDPFRVYPSPFDANGAVQPGALVGPVSASMTWKTTYKWDSLKARESKIFALLSGAHIVHTLTIGPTAIAEDPSPLTLDNYSTDIWNPIDAGFVTIKDKTGLDKTYLTVEASLDSSGQSGEYLINVDDLTDNFATDVHDLAVVDPEERYIIKDLWYEGKTVLYDNFTGKSALIAAEDIYPLRGHTAFIATGLNPMWQILSTSGKAYLVQLTDPVNLTIDVNVQPFPMFQDVYTAYGSAGGQACVSLPNPSVTATTITTGTDIGIADVDAGSSDTGDGLVDADAGSASDAELGDAAVETLGGTDAAVEEAEVVDAVALDTAEVTDVGFSEMPDALGDVTAADLTQDVPTADGEVAEPDGTPADSALQPDAADGTDAASDAAGTDAAVVDGPDALVGTDAEAADVAASAAAAGAKSGCDAGPAKAGSANVPAGKALLAALAGLALRRKRAT